VGTSQASGGREVRGVRSGLGPGSRRADWVEFLRIEDEKFGDSKAGRRAVFGAARRTAETESKRQQELANSETCGAGKPGATRSTVGGGLTT